MAEYIYFGTGQYRVDSRNISTLIKAAKDVLDGKEMKWCLKDHLGVDWDGSKGPRFSEFVEEASEYISLDPRIEEIISLVESIKVLPKGESYPRNRIPRGPLGPRGSISEAKEKEMLAAAKALGIPESEVQARIDKMRAEAEAKKASAGFDALLKLGYTKEQITALVEAKKAANE